MPIRAVLFDLDDTLNDRAASWRNFANLLVDHGHLLPGTEIDAVCQRVLFADRGGYRPKEELFADLCQQLPWRTPKTHEQLESIWRSQFPSCMVIREGAGSLLNFLRQSGLRLGVVSNGRQDMQSAKLESMGLKAGFSCIVISGAIGVKKPDPRIYEEAVKILSVAAAETLFVGDHPQLDVCAPRALGMKTVWLRLGREWGAQDPPPDYIIDTLLDLIPIVTR